MKMKNILKISLLVIFLVFGFSVGLVSAEENNGDLKEFDNNEIVNDLGTNGYIGTGGNFTTLQEDVNNAIDDEGILNLKGNYTWDTGDSIHGIGINGNLIINGNGNTIDAQNSSRIFFTETGSNVTLNNIKLINGYTSGNYAYGAAIYNFANLTIDNCTFINNTAIGTGGGAIYNYGVANVIIFNSSFISNAASWGGAIYNSNGVNFTVFGSTFTSNTATIYGGAILNRDGVNFTVFCSTFISNTASMGGAIYNSDGVNFAVFGSTFISNTASMGGAIYNFEGVNFTVFGSNFTSNAASRGGAIYNIGIFSILNASYSVFYNSTVFIAGGNVNLSCNFWGDNNPNFNRLINSTNRYILDNFIQVFLAVDSSENILYAGDNLNYHINITLNDTSVVFDVDKLPQLLVNIQNNKGDVLNNFIAQEYDISNKANIITESGTSNLNLYFNDILLDEIVYTVNKHEIAMDLNDICSVYGKETIISIDSNVTGNMSLTIGNKTYNSIIDSGMAIFEFDLSPGNYEGIISYSGDDMFNEFSKPINLTINKSDVLLISNNIVMFYRNGTQYYVILLDSNEQPLINQTVQITVNGITYNKTTNNSGIATLNINLNPNNYTITTFFNGNDNYNNESIVNNLTVISTIKANNLVKYYLNETQYDVQVLDKQGNPLSNTTVLFNINGKMYNRTTKNNGIATLNINLNPGFYVITITTENGLSMSNNITVLSTLVGFDLNKTFNEEKSYEILVRDNIGQPFKGQVVEININGIIYDKITNDRGMAKLDINLNPGSYIATATFKGYSTSNIIRVS